MAVHELIPTFQGLRDSATRLASLASEQEKNPELRAAKSDFSLGGVDSLLRSLAAELDGQIRTAERPFTVAVVGEFKVGKSTFINALLGLHGGDALSAKDDPDTACSVLLRARQDGDPEARLMFFDGNSEETTWGRAIGLTSQVWLDEHPEDQATAARLIEVQYFVKSSLLSRFQINDLPGTGSRFWREHSALTHRKMKEADAILWVVSGEREPSADGKRNLEILRDCAHQVVPIVTVFEDPSAEPPLPRDDAAVDRVCRVLKREYADYFASDTAEPILISSKVILLETSRATPRTDVLERAGFTELTGLVGQLSASAESGAGAARTRRLCGAGISLGNRIGEAAHSLDTTTCRLLPQFEAQAARAAQRLDEIDAVRHDARGRIKSLAREAAQRICQKVGRQGGIFVEDTLQLSNIEDLGTALSRDGRTKLEDKLKKRFLNEYLQLDKSPNWVDELGVTFAGDVRDVVTPLWRQLLSRLPEAESPSGGASAPSFNLAGLHSALIQAVVSVIGRLLSVVGVAAILAWIPGGQIVDAIGIVGILLISVFHDPLSGARRRAAERVRLQADAQQYEIQNRMLEAGLAGNDVVERHVREVLGLGHDTASRNAGRIHDVIREARETGENARTSIQAFEHVLRGGAA